jgi:amidase
MGDTSSADLAFMSATEQAKLLRTRQVSPVELTSLYLERIERYDGPMRSYVTVATDSALQQAREAERWIAVGGDCPPFCGVPISVKDMADTAGVRTTRSCRALADYVPSTDAPVVRRLKRGGFIILGKTNTPELGALPVTESELNGVCRNPWDTSRTPGGSSGGAAAALTSGLCPLSHGRDGAGSIRIPASCCGVFGLKPSRGRVPGASQMGLVDGVTEGPITRTVLDAAGMLDVVSSEHHSFSREVSISPGQLRIAYTTRPPIDCHVDPECVRATEDVARLMEGLGHVVVNDAPDWYDAEALCNFMTLRQTLPLMYEDAPPSTLERHNATFVRMAEATSSAQLIHAMVSLRKLATRVLKLWEQYDLLLTPTLALLPVHIGWLFEETEVTRQFFRAASFAPFSALFNITGQPAASLPLYWSESGMPVGVQLVGRLSEDAQLIRVSAQLETARPWAGRRPPYVNL